MYSFKILGLKGNYIFKPPIILADLNVEVVTFARNPLLESMGYEKFKGLGDSEASVEDNVGLIQEFKEKLREHKIMETNEVSSRQELGFI